MLSIFHSGTSKIAPVNQSECSTESAWGEIKAHAAKGPSPARGPCKLAENVNSLFIFCVII